MQRARSANLIPYAHVNCFVLHTCGLGDTDVVKGFRTPQQVTAKDPTLARSETEESFLEAHASTYIYIYEYIDGPSLQNFQCYSNTVAMVSSECSVSWVPMFSPGVRQCWSYNWPRQRNLWKNWKQSWQTKTSRWRCKTSQSEDHWVQVMSTGLDFWLAPRIVLSFSLMFHAGPCFDPHGCCWLQLWLSSLHATWIILRGTPSACKGGCPPEQGNH